jgi:hypothetical protein
MRVLSKTIYSKEKAFTNGLTKMFTKVLSSKANSMDLAYLLNLMVNLIVDFSKIIKEKVMELQSNQRMAVMKSLKSL